MMQLKDMHVNSMINTIDEAELIVPIAKNLSFKALVVVIINFDITVIDKYDEMESALTGRGSYTYALKKMVLDMKNRVTLPTNPSTEEPPIIKLKTHFSHPYYVFLGKNNTLSVITIAYLFKWQVKALVSILPRLK